MGERQPSQTALAAAAARAAHLVVDQRDAVPPALWDRTDVLRPADLCRLARATVAPWPAVRWRR